MSHPLLTRRQKRAIEQRLHHQLAGAVGRVFMIERGAGLAGMEERSLGTVVVSGFLCSDPDPDETLAAAKRWLVPGGRLLFLEHVAGVGTRGWLQRAAAPLWAKVSRGCRPDRDAINLLRGAGFAVTDCERFVLPGPNPLLSTWVQGVARPRPLVPDPEDTPAEKEELTR
jgi:SAM-dependent methyltransferase